jgi:hypothetical protein
MAHPPEVDFKNGPQIKSRPIQGAKVDVVEADTSAYSALANDPLEDLTIPSKTDEVIRQIDKPKGAKFDQRIAKAKADGNTSKAARLTGKQERYNIRDENRASRITAKNKDKKEALTKSEFFKGQKFNERQKEKGGATSASHLFKSTILKPKGYAETKPEFSLVSPFNIKTFDKFSTIAKKL